VAWLVRDGDVLATVEVVDSASARIRGVAAVRDLDGALLMRRPFVLHTFASAPPVDVAFCDRGLCVASISSLARHRVARPRPRAASVVVARAGAFERWGLSVGDRLEVKGA
jgi:uncharacterized membrane protein (UPF0127 family)